MIRYATLLDGHDWDAHAYPSGAFCVVMVNDDDGTIETDITLTDFQASNPGLVDEGFTTTLGMVYGADGVAMNLVPIRADADYGTLYNSIEDLIDNIPSYARVEERVREEMNENLIVREWSADAHLWHWQQRVFVAVVILLFIIVLGVLTFGLPHF